MVDSGRPSRKARALGGSSILAVTRFSLARLLPGGVVVLGVLLGPTFSHGSGLPAGERLVTRVPIESRQSVHSRPVVARRESVSGPPKVAKSARGGRVGNAAPLSRVLSRAPAAAMPAAATPPSTFSVAAPQELAPPQLEAGPGEARLAAAASLPAAEIAPEAAALAVPAAAALAEAEPAGLPARDAEQAFASVMVPSLVEAAVPEPAALPAATGFDPLVSQAGEAASAPAVLPGSDIVAAFAPADVQPVADTAGQGAELAAVPTGPGLEAAAFAAPREPRSAATQPEQRAAFAASIAVLEERTAFAAPLVPPQEALAPTPASAPAAAPAQTAAPASVTAPPVVPEPALAMAPRPDAVQAGVARAAPEALTDVTDPAFAVTSQLGATINGRFAGWLDFRQRLDGLDIRLGSILGLLADRFAKDRLAQLQGSAAAQEYVPLAVIQARGVPLRYDPVADAFAIETRRATGAAPLPEGRLAQAGPPAAPSMLLTAAAAGQDVGLPSALPREQELQLPVMVDDSYRGDIDVLIGSDNRLKVRLDSVLAALSRLLRPDVAEALAALPAPGGLVDAGALAPAVELRLDETTIEVVATIPPGSRPRSDVSLFEDPNANIEYIQPQSFAAAMAIDFGGGYSFKQPTGFGGEAGRIASWVNLGGADGVFIDAEMFYDSEGEASFRRGDIRISMDDPDKAIRYSAGDVLYLTQGFQGAPRIGGIGVQRLYEELNPLRIIRPQGRTSFTLDRAATVEVIVNGVPFRTVRFDPGTYSINDIPYAEGGNNVELLIRDDSGVERRLEFSGYSSANLLAEGLSEFGIVAGFQSDFTARGIRYNDDEPVASGFYRVGVSSNLTLGANAQIGSSVAQIGGEAIFGGDDLLVFARAAFSDLDGRGSGYAWEVNAQYRPLSTGGINGFFLEGNARGTSRDFASLGIEDPRNDFKLETAVRGGFSIDQDSNVSLGYTRQFARDDASDITRYSLTASRRFGNLAAFATFDRREVEGQETENRFLVTLSLPLGSRSTYARAAFDSDRDAYRVEVQRLPRGAVNDLSGTVAIETNENGQEVLGQVRYRHNRFIAGLDNSIIFPDAESATGTAVARYSLRTGIGYTDGRVLVSPTLGEGSFVAVAKGRGITEGQVILNDSPIGPQAVSGSLGPAVFGGIRGYVPMRVTADVETETAGFEGASQTINVLPGARTGYLVSVGDEATAIVVATVLLPDGSPASLLAGTLERTDGKGERIETFTNRSGRLVAEDLTAGTYRLLVPGKGATRFTLVEDQVGIVQLGTLTLGPLEEQEIVR